MDASVLVEALSILTRKKVKLHTESSGTGIDIAELTVQNFVSSALLPLILRKDEPIADPPTTDDPQELVVDLSSFYAPSFNYDFRNFTECEEVTRAGEPYQRPAGWFRFALQVLNKYPDGNAWLGPGGWRNTSSPGEWPVSYHGTGRVGGTRLEGSPEFGIYSTPDVKLAETDGELHKEFTSKNGRSYRVIMQNRINPTIRVKKNPNLWLVPVPLDVYAMREDQRKKKMRDIVDEAIRPYGILIKEMK